VGNANFAVEDAARSGKLVAELKHVNKAFEGRDIIRDFSTIIQRGDRVALIIKSYGVWVSKSGFGASIIAESVIWHRAEGVQKLPEFSQFKFA
jgi:hypothetical protein